MNAAIVVDAAIKERADTMDELEVIVDELVERLRRQDRRPFLPAGGATGRRWSWWGSR